MLLQYLQLRMFKCCDSLIDRYAIERICIYGKSNDLLYIYI